MSRIHEALKRAEQERAMPLGAPPPIMPEVPAEVAAEELKELRQSEVAPETRPSGLVDPLGRTGAEVRTGAADYMRFDDIWNHCANPVWRFHLDRNVFENSGIPASVREQFRTLRSRLYQIRDKQPLHSVLVTSSLPGEGKTFVANNLAQALARQENCKVLLIDADLRRPDLHLGFDAPSSPGLSEYLKGEADELTIIQRGVPEYLCFIPGGSRVENPAELLANGRLKSFIERIGPVFDWVILDSPPTLPVSDALVLAEICDGVLTVVRAAHTGFDTAQKSCHQLRDKNLLGVALNCADEGAQYGSYYEYEERLASSTV